MSNKTNQEWLNRNSTRSFPIAEDSNMLCLNGAYFPNSILLDMRVCFFGSLEPDVSIVAAQIDDGVATVVFSICGKWYSFSGNGLMHGKNNDFSVVAYVAGRSVLREIDGDYTLATPAKLVPGRVVDMRYGIGVDTLSCINGLTAYGTIKVEDGHNTELNVVDNKLHLTIGDGLGKGVKCSKQYGDYICDGAVLYYLNGQKAGADGNIVIQAGDGIRVYSGVYDGGIPAVFIATDESVNGFLYNE